MGADNICLKDMANILLPYTAYEIIKGMKEVLKPETKIHLHTHNTTGTGDMVYLKAIEAGCDIVDCALSAMGNGTSQPATEPFVATLKGTEYDTGIDIEKLVPINEHFKKVAARLEKDGILNPKVRQIDVNTLLYQVPGGMLSNLMSQLKQAGKLDLLTECLQEVPNVRKDSGYPPLVTPSSQIVGTQAVFNVLQGERYKMVTKEFKALIKGEYGQLIGEPDKDVVKKILGDEKRITYRPADDIPPEYEKFKEEMKEYYTQEEDVLSYALFNQVAINFFKYRLARDKKIDADLAKGTVYPV
jgi:oxaloacetate decarboxylase alpha subunit